MDYISKLLVYDPKLRPTGLQCCMHVASLPPELARWAYHAYLSLATSVCVAKALFDDLRDPNTCGSPDCILMGSTMRDWCATARRISSSKPLPDSC